MRVTFDTNVWNRMVFPERNSCRPNHTALVKLKDAVQAGRISGFISEGFATIETIQRGERAKYHAQNIPKVEVRHKSHGPGLHGLAILINADHALHPGISEEFEAEFKEAVAIGIKLLSTPYVGLPIPDALRDNPTLYAEEVFRTTDYNERFGDVVQTINARGVGEGALPALTKELKAQLDGPLPAGFQDRALISGAHAWACTPEDTKEKKKIRKQIEDAFGEAADGDAVAAHIAFGNDYLCTDDRGFSKRTSSIFDADNRAWLKATYGVKILSAQQLADLL